MGGSWRPGLGAMGGRGSYAEMPNDGCRKGNPAGKGVGRSGAEEGSMG